MKKWLNLFVGLIITVSFAGCLNSSSSDDGENSLTVYSSMNHGFIEDLMAHFKETINDEMPNDHLLQGEVTAVLKVIGKVAQVAGKVKGKSDQNAFEASVLSDLSAIKDQLNGLEDQVKKGFNSVNAKLGESEVLDTWNSMCDSQLIVIDTAWNHYLDPDGIEGLINILDAEDAPDAEIYETAVADFIKSIESSGITNIEQALLDIRNHIDGSYSSILKQVVDYLSLQYIASYKDQEAFDSILASYLNFYMQMINYEIKGTILLSEYYNYTDVDADEVILTEDGYQTITSANAKRKIESFVSDLKKQLTSFVNCGERLISQFNGGDIYRDYEDSSNLVRNSNYFPYIDYFTKIAYGYENIFVFRLAWSEELVSNDPDGSKDFSDYEDLYEGLCDANTAVSFILKRNNSFINPEIDENNSLNLSCISTFKLYAEGDSTKSFNGGVRRYVFQGLPDSTLDLYMSQAGLTENFTFDFNSGFSENIHLFAARGASTFNPEDLLSENNPLSEFDNSPQCISFTFGAYLSRYEFLKGENFVDFTLYDSSKSYEQQAQLLYAAVTTDHYYVETSGNKHIEVDDDKASASFTVVPVDHTSTSEISDGDQVAMYVVYSHSDKAHHGYMYQNGRDSGDTIKFKEGMDNAIKFNIHKKYLFPSGKLYSNDTITKMNIFVLEAGDVCAHTMSADHDRRLEFYKKDYNHENNWFFIIE